MISPSTSASPKRLSRNTAGRTSSATVGKALYEMATHGGEVAATIFWSKTRGSFREHQETPTPPPAVIPNFVVSLEKKGQ
jgi:hypothetical protein